MGKIIPSRIGLLSGSRHPYEILQNEREKCEA